MCNKKIAPEKRSIAWRNNLKRYALERGVNPVLLQEYIDEIEWQDGVEYWRIFKTAAEFLEDVLAWIEVVNDGVELVYDEEEMLA